MMFFKSREIRKATMPVNLEANAPADCGITLQEMQGKKKVTSHCTFCTYIYTKTIILIKLKKKNNPHIRRSC